MNTLERARAHEQEQLEDNALIVKETLWLTDNNYH
jgi:hypothetical protein